MTTLALGPSWLDPELLLNKFGLIGLLIIVFAESGLLIGFFLPGDSLLFTTGMLVTANVLDHPLWLVCTLVCVAAILGDQAGYLFGRKVGPALFNRPDSRLFKQENVTKAHEFFEKYGPKSLVLARFVPIVRTFTPIIAGVSRMNYRSFITYNILGGVLWGAGVTLLGAWLGQIDFVRKNIEPILILIVLISVVPIIVEFLRARSKSKKAAAEAPTQNAQNAQNTQSTQNPQSAQAPGVDHPTQQLHAHRPHQNQPHQPYQGQPHQAPHQGQPHQPHQGQQGHPEPPQRGRHAKR
ncbi:DedA family protein [Streptomyces luteolus]|uniref:DedA family protein n=1 Tax=Streptomyces luteolus TaxID=3043615 RepID=A0ABT6SV04_9ACTN|nr:DedA family protein [Streptomyces sp. B-S-A12]MDI3418452.1 DedA family protein [Streptomyces sp. B-S-A12]